MRSAYDYTCPACDAPRGRACRPFYPDEIQAGESHLDRPHVGRQKIAGEVWAPQTLEEVGRGGYAMQLLARLVRETKTELAEEERRLPPDQRCTCHRAAAHKRGYHHRVKVSGNLVRAAAALLLATTKGRG